MKRLPTTLVGANWIYYPNVKRSAMSHINLIDHRTRTEGKKRAAKSQQIRAAKGNLEKLFEHLDNKSNWNAEKPERNPFSNKMNTKIEYITPKKLPVKKEGNTSKTDDHINFPRDQGAFVDTENKNIALPYGFEQSKDVIKAIKALKKINYLVTFSTVPLVN